MARVDDRIEAENAAWSFDNIADDFDDHVSRSVPLYDEGHKLVCRISDFFVPREGVVTEFGTSTGKLAAAFLEHHRNRADMRYIGIDPVEGMIAKARQRCGDDPRASFLVDDVVTCALEPSNLIISYYTLQFIHPRHRQDVFNRIYENLQWGGALLLFEKVRGPDARFQDILSQVYNDFKLENGFSEAEIINKSRSLKGVLEPFSSRGNLDLMERAGFSDVMTVMKWMCFEGFLAIK